MIKLVFCLRRLPTLSREEFQHYWYNTHAPLVRSHAEVLGIRRYVQVHSFEDSLSAGLQRSRGGPAPYDGVAELWYDSLEALGERSPERTQAGRELLEDERRFIDLANSPLWFAEEKGVVS